jgi:hypothetical protein
LGSIVSGATVVLQWAAPAAYQTASYILEAGSAPGQTDQAYSDTGNSLATYTASDVPPGVYYVRIRARRTDGALSAASNETVVNVGGPSGTCPAPQPPSRLSSVVDGSTVTLIWQANGTSASYVLEAGSTPGAADLALLDTQSASTSYTAFNVGGGTYFVRLRATSGCGARSGASNEIVVRVGP